MNTVEQPKPEIEKAQPSTFDVRRSMFDVQKISSCLFWIKRFFDYLNGAEEEPPPGATFISSPLFIGLWWSLMIGLILLFCGQTSKFIYIDF